MSILFALGMNESCVSKVYPDDRLAIDPAFSALFNSVVQKNTFSFRDTAGNRRVFVITKVDTIISNEKGWFINERPYKLLSTNFREAGQDTVDLDRGNEIFVNKYPDNNSSSIVIQFNNFYFNDTILPPLHHDVLNLNGKRLTNYYLFETSLEFKRPNDIKDLYMNPAKGFLAFKTVSGEVWINEIE